LLRLQPVDNSGKRLGEGKTRRAKNFADDKRDQRIWPVAECDGVGSLQIRGDRHVKSHLVLRRFKLKRQRAAFGVTDEPRLLHLPAQSTFADRLQPFAEKEKRIASVTRIHIGGAKDPFIAEEMLVQNGNQSVKLKKGILERRSGEKHLEEGAGGIAQLFGADGGALLVNVPQPMGFVENHQIPAATRNVIGLRRREFIGRDDDFAVLVERTIHAALLGVVVHLGLDDDRGERELVRQFLTPLLAQRGGDD